MTGKPLRVLVTGFGPFPGAAENPTEELVERLLADPPTVPAIRAFHAEVLDVEYGSVEARLSAIGREHFPDVALHFGLAAEASGFRLERVARNTHARARADNAGRLPSTGPICEGPDTLESSLPLERIARDLAAAGLPVEWSDDAGGYLCNTVFVLSRFHACAGFAPAMSGFIHVPSLGGEGAALTPRQLEAGARVAIAACAAAWANTG